MIRRTALATAATLLATAPALADHGAPFRTGGMSPLASALLTGALAFVAALVIVILVMLLTRPKQDQK